jgi:hypothetical protein
MTNVFEPQNLYRLVSAERSIECGGAAFVFGDSGMAWGLGWSVNRMDKGAGDAKDSFKVWIIFGQLSHFSSV